MPDSEDLARILQYLDDRRFEREIVDQDPVLDQIVRTVRVVVSQEQ